MHLDMGGAGKLAGRYRLLDPVDAAPVRPAFDESGRREVAVRELRLPPELREAALHRARAATALRHPSIVPVLDVVVAGGTPWLVMEPVAGTSLERAVGSRGPLPVTQAARAGVGVLAALTAGHAAAYVHGNVEPGNVLLTARGRAVLTGFGLPSRSTWPSADLWSLGATLHFAVEGRPPRENPAPGPDPLRSLIRAMLGPAGPPPVEVIRETLERLAVDQPLDRLIEALGPLPPAEVAAIGLAIVERLRDGPGPHGGVQPGNVLVDGEGRATLLPSLRSGTPPAYAAPEGVLSPAADLWSLGATLFAAVEGRPPAPGAPLVRAGALAPLLFRLLSGDPAERPALEELARELRALDPRSR
ncbi:protein kinase [Nonomuraea sp. NPDC050783]|uniref:protein kinase domain-containing protein n=1 Tax=Nonomuraea sp. NPDC050783 TaxID=3154634 RepID=UPI003467CE57